MINQFNNADILNYYIKKDGNWIQENEEISGEDSILRQKISLINYHIPQIRENEIKTQYISLKGEFKDIDAEHHHLIKNEYYIPFIKIYKNEEKKYEFNYPINDLINDSFEKLYNDYKKKKNFINMIKEESNKEKNNTNQMSTYSKFPLYNKKEIISYYSFFSVANLILENEKFFNDIKLRFNLKENFHDSESKINMVDSLYSELKSKREYIKQNAIKTTENYSLLTNNEIIEVQNQIKEDYYNENNIKIDKYKMNNAIKNLKEKIKESETIEFIKIPETNSKAYIINEDSTNIAKKRDEQEGTQINITKENIALNALEIPYSVLLISDENFKILIKDYNEIHSDEIIQRIFDCIFIDRFYTSLSNAMKFAVNNLHYQPKEERPFRAFFVFSNGLDDQLYFVKDWKEKIFKSSATHEKDKFGFIFIKGEELIEENEKIINIWNKFEAFNKDQISICKILSPNLINDYENISKNFANIFSETLGFTNIEINNNISKINKKFEAIFDLKMLELKNIKNFEDCIISKQFEQGIYACNTDVLSKANTLSIPIDIQYYKNKIK